MENIDISHENSSISDQNLNSLNSLNKETDCFTELRTFDIVLVSETKLDEPFQNNQFSISSYRMFRKDRNCFGGGLCIYGKENIASKQLNSHLDKETRNKRTIKKMAHCRFTQVP